MSNPQHFYKGESKKNWYSEHQVTPEQLTIGCLMRIADSLEIIGRERVFTELKYAEERKEQLYKENKHFERRIRSLKGAITKLKRRKK